MSRNDSALLTGMNSGTVSKVEREQRAKRKKEKEKKLKKKSIVAPTIEPVLEEINKEEQATIIAQMDLVDGDTEDFKSMALALKLYKESCKNLRNRLTKIMRVEAD